MILKLLVLSAFVKYGLCDSDFVTDHVKFVTVTEKANGDLQLQSSDKQDFQAETQCKVGTQKGYCVSPSLCKRRNGINLDKISIFKSSCSNYYVCCQPIVSCGNVTSLYTVLFTLGTNDVRSTGICMLQIRATNPTVSQIRLDFIQMSLSLPTVAAGTSANLCNYDKFQVQGQTNTVPEICGNVTDQHMYVHLDQKMGITEVEIIIRFETVITVALDSAIVTDPFVHILITQLDDNQENLELQAPNGCLQYFISNVGVIKSFNYDDSLLLDSNTQIANQHYSICFKKYLFAKCIALKPRTFSISGKVGKCSDKISCLGMVLNNGKTASSVSGNEMCGKLDGTDKLFCPEPGPLLLRVDTDDTTDDTDKGFFIDFDNPPNGSCD